MRGNLLRRSIEYALTLFLAVSLNFLLPRLMPGEPLTLRSTTPLRIFRHEGYVVGRRQLSIENWEMILRNPPAPEGLDEAAAPP